jgi:carboxyl-terminal processing protease
MSGAPGHPRRALAPELGPEPSRAPHPAARSLLPGAVVVAVLLAVSLFAAGYVLGDDGVGTPSAPGEGGLDALTQAYERITGDFVGEVDPDALVAAAIEAMFETLDDPYSSYMGADRFDTDLADVSGEFEGIGARMVSQDAAGEACQPMGDACRLVVVDVLTDSPAADAGLQGGDEVRAIDDRPISGLTMGDAIELIRGPSGTDVELGVEREGADLALTITRELIREQDVRSAVLADGRVGYLRVDTFSVGAADDFHGQLRAHLEAGIEAFVVDVRDDPGGFVDAAVTMTSEFLPDGPVYQEEEAGGERRVIDARAGGLATDPGIDIAVLIDDGTASASEILAGALGARDRATLVGETTFGKGTIQEWTELPGDNGGFRLSVARWLLPDGSSIDGVGVPPDIEVVGPETVSGLEVDEEALAQDPVVKAALGVLLADDPDPADPATPRPVSSTRSPAGDPAPSPGVASPMPPS